MINHKKFLNLPKLDSLKVVTNPAINVANSMNSWILETSKTVTNTITKAGSDTIARVMSTIFTPCTVPVFLLPTGCGSQDFICHFCFDEAVNKLENGVFVRPQLEIWAGDEEIDRTYLAEIIKQDFTQQLEQTRQKTVILNQNKYTQTLEELKQQQKKLEKTTGNTIQNVANYIGVGLLTMFFVANPLFYLIFFSLAIFTGIDGLAKGIKYWKISSELSGNENKLKVEQKKFEAELDNKNTIFQEAINNMKISLHPILHELKELFCELENIPFTPQEVETDNVHPTLIIQLLTESDYRENLPLEYHSFLDYLIEKHSTSQFQRLSVKNK
ncbi:hypothetical protein cce_4319 [Crocosphaera subtropica ATCC 51142]|uniref:Uncharacterized protein n=1 Tax=Crocosphaera subtropica (strain ATCC 51142 / BH68) TaxID=43989 RepID=B1WTF2_CROS5|nr:hypothetical protein [Crocosphaera subtropica]ACB53667.1 hypothetical protein cce_4319 [Crocosphaera subtropica ATCC 51142]